MFPIIIGIHRLPSREIL